MRLLTPALFFGVSALALASRGARAEDKPAAAPAREAEKPAAAQNGADGGLPILDDPHRKSHGHTTGAERGVQLRGIKTNDVDLGQTSERGPRVVSRAPVAGAAEPDPGLVYELVQKQMRRWQPSIDKCKKPAQKRGLTGSVVLGIKVDDHKVADAAIKGDTMNDPKLDECLLKASRGWTFTVASADFQWQVDLEAEEMPAAKH